MPLRRVRGEGLFFLDPIVRECFKFFIKNKVGYVCVFDN